MCNKARGKILDIAAELIVSPLAAVAKAHEIKEELNEYETYVKAKDTVKSAAGDVKKAAEKVYENETVQKGVGAVKETAKKVSESEAAVKVKKGLSKAEEAVAEAASKIHVGKKEGSEGCGKAEDTASEETSQTDGTPEQTEENAPVPETENEPAEEAKAAEAEKVFAGNIEEVIDEIDLSGIITEEDAKEDIPGE